MEDKIKFLHSLLNDRSHGSEFTIKFDGYRFSISGSGYDGAIRVSHQNESLGTALEEARIQIATKADKLWRMQKSFEALVKKVNEEPKG